jgi:hypothetical protein
MKNGVYEITDPINVKKVSDELGNIVTGKGGAEININGITIAGNRVTIRWDNLSREVNMVVLSSAN